MRDVGVATVAQVVRARSLLSGGQEAREEARDEGFEGRKTGTNDGDVDLNAGPDGDADVVVGEVFRDRGLLERGDAEDRDNADAGHVSMYNS